MTKRLLLAAVLAAAAAAPAAAQNRCSHDALTIRDTPVAVTFCIVATTAANAVSTVVIEATYSSKTGSFVQRSSVRFVTGGGPARAIQSIALDPLGIPGVLHMTLLYNGNEVTMEHALLTPGAITVK